MNRGRLLRSWRAWETYPPDLEAEIQDRYGVVVVAPKKEG